MRRNDDLQAKKQLLIAQAEFDRLKVAMAVHDLRRSIRPSFDAGDVPTTRSAASRLLGFALPLLGARAGRIVRALSIALSIYRFMRGARAA
jgi:hypothetical protein